MNYSNMTPEEILECIDSEKNSVACAKQNKIIAEQFYQQSIDRLAEAESAYAKAWAEHCFDAIEATSQSAEAFDSSPLGELYFKITGCTMATNLGAQTL